MKGLWLAAALGLGFALHAAADEERGSPSRTTAASQNPDVGLEPGRCDGRGGGPTSGSRISLRRLLGARVTNPIDEDIGEVFDLIVDGCGRIADLVVQVGGFMGLGARYVQIPPGKVRILPAGHPAGMAVIVRATREHILSGREPADRDGC